MRLVAYGVASQQGRGNMEKYNSEWFRARALERIARRQVTRKSHQEIIEQDMEELEEYKNKLLWDVRAEKLLTPEAYKKYKLANALNRL